MRPWRSVSPSGELSRQRGELSIAAISQLCSANKRLLRTWRVRLWQNVFFHFPPFPRRIPYATKQGSEYET